MRSLYEKSSWQILQDKDGVALGVTNRPEVSAAGGSADAELPERSAEPAGPSPTSISEGGFPPPGPLSLGKLTGACLDLGNVLCRQLDIVRSRAVTRRSSVRKCCPDASRRNLDSCTSWRR